MRSMPAGHGGMDIPPLELYAQARAARRQSRVLAARHRAAEQAAGEILQRIHAARDRAEQIGELWLAARPDTDRLRYSAYARLQARLASMPVIEQAKGIIMAQCGWPEDQAFDALRRASQRANIKVRDLAAQVVAKTVSSASAQRQASPARTAAPVNEVTHALARRHSRTLAHRTAGEIKAGPAPRTARKYSSRSAPS